MADARDPFGINWPAAMSVAAVLLLLMSSSQFPVSLLPEMLSDLDLPLTFVGIFFTSVAVGRLMMDLPAGRFVDSVGLRVALPASAIGTTLGMVMLVQSRSTFLLLAAGAVMGASIATANTSAMAYFSKTAPVRQRGMAMSFYAGGVLGGVALGPALGGWLSVGWGWRGSLIAGAGIAATGTVVAIHSRNRILAASRRVATRDEVQAAIGGNPILGRIALRSVMFSVSYSIGGMLQTIVPITGVGTIGLSTAALGTILGVGGAFRFVGIFVAGFLADRIPRKRILVPGLLLQALGVIVLNVDSSRMGLTIAVVASSTFTVGVTLSAAMLGDLTSSHRIGRELGMFRFVGDLGMASGPAVSTLLIRAGRTDLANLLVAVLLVASAGGVAFGVPETNRRTMVLSA